jgi:5-hydroxyisourate hydrolase-like protein (transthyretin family)
MAAFRTSVRVALVAAFLALPYARIALAQDQPLPPKVSVHIVVHVTNAENGTLVPGRGVYVSHDQIRAAGYSSFESEDTNNDGTAVLDRELLPGTWTVGVNVCCLFELNGAKRTIEIVPTQTNYEVFIALRPLHQQIRLFDPAKDSENLRNIIVRVQGRMADGSLVPVKFAVITNRNGYQFGSTDESGVLTFQHNVKLGELFEVHAEVPDNVYQRRLFAPGSATVVVGSAPGGSRLLQVDDGVTIVLEHEGDTTTEISGTHLIFISVQGRMPNGTLVPIHYATIYDAQGKKIPLYDAHVKGKPILFPGDDGQAIGRVPDVVLGDTYQLTAEANHWKTASETVTAGANTDNRPTYSNDSVTFVLEPAPAASQLTVEVRNHDTDQPVAGAKVTLYKPDGFPGTSVGTAVTNAAGEVTFSSDIIDQARAGDGPRVGVSAASYSDSNIQTVNASILTQSDARYVVFLSSKPAASGWAGTWTQDTFSPNYGKGTDTIVITAQGAILSIAEEFRYVDGLNTSTSNYTCTIINFVQPPGAAKILAAAECQSAAFGKFNLNLMQDGTLIGNTMFPYHRVK